MDVITFPENLLTTSGLSILKTAWRYFTPRMQEMMYSMHALPAKFKCTKRNYTRYENCINYYDNLP